MMTRKHVARKNNVKAMEVNTGRGVLVLGGRTGKKPEEGKLSATRGRKQKGDYEGTESGENGFERTMTSAGRVAIEVKNR